MVQTGTSWVIKRLKILRDAALKSRLQTMVVADIANLVLLLPPLPLMLLRLQLEGLLPH